MIYETSLTAVGVFAFFVAVVLGISFYLGAKAKSASGYFAAHGQIPWFVNGVAFAGDYLSAASFLGICGMIAFYGYDGFLYSIGYLAGWIVALLRHRRAAQAARQVHVRRRPRQPVQQPRHQAGRRDQHAGREPLLSDPADGRRRGAGQAAARLLAPGRASSPSAWSSILIVVTAGMVSTTWVQFIKGALLVVFCTILTVMILRRGLDDRDRVGRRPQPAFESTGCRTPRRPAESLPESGRLEGQAVTSASRRPPRGDRLRLAAKMIRHAWRRRWPAQTLHRAAGRHEAGQRPAARQGRGPGRPRSRSASVLQLPDGRTRTGPLGPLSFLTTLPEQRDRSSGRSDKIRDEDGSDDDGLSTPSRRQAGDVLAARRPARRSRASAATRVWPTSSTSSR